MEKARAAEAAATQTKVIERAGEKEHVKSEPIAAISSRGPTKYQQGKNDQKTASTRNRNQAASQGNKRIDSTKKCFACGYEYPHKDECPAQESKCRKCNEVGHFAKSRLCTKNRVNFIDQEDEEREYIFFVGSGGHRPQIEIAIDGQTIKTLIDSGAQVNLIGQSTNDSLSSKPIETARRLDLFSTQAFRKPVDIASVDEPEDRYKNLAKEFNDVISDRVGTLQNYSVRLQIDKSVPTV